VLLQVETDAKNGNPNCHVGEILYLTEKLAPASVRVGEAGANSGVRCSRKNCKSQKVVASGLCFDDLLLKKVMPRYEILAQRVKRGKFTAAYDDFKREKSAKSYALLDEVFSEAEMHLKADPNDEEIELEDEESAPSSSSSSSEFEEEEEESSSSASGLGESSSTTITKKRERSPDDYEPLPDPYFKKALVICTDEEAARLNALVDNGEIARMRELACKIINKKAPQYRVIFKKRDTNDITDRFDKLRGTAGMLFYTEEKANAFAADVLKDVPNNPYIYEVIHVEIK
jgi:hypothetical protein